MATTAKTVKDLNDTRTALSREHRLLQQALGIGRAARGEQINIEEQIRKWREAARARVEKESTPIRCANCVSDFNLGFILFHFRDDVPWSFSFQCPKCQTLNHLTGQVAFQTEPF